MKPDDIKFNPGIHDKEYVLNNSEQTLHWAKFSPRFQQSNLVQDFDVLSINDGEVARKLANYSPSWAVSPAAQEKRALNLDGGSVGYLLASTRHEWSKTPAAQDIEILSMYKGRVATALAQTALYWSSTSAAQDINILSLDHGYVAMELAKRSYEWSLTPAAQSMEVLKLNHGGVMRELIKRSPEWFESRAAYNKDILLLSPKALTGLSFIEDDSQDESVMSVTLAKLIHRYIVTGAMHCILRNIYIDGGAESKMEKVFDKVFYTVSLPTLDAYLDESLALLSTDGHLFDRAVLLARIAITYNALPGIYTEHASKLQESSVHYTEKLTNLIKAMAPNQFEQLCARCKEKGEVVEFELLNKINLASGLESFVSDSGLSCGDDASLPPPPFKY